MLDAAIVRFVNLALLIFGILRAFAMMLSFGKDLLRSRSQKLFFSKIAVTTGGMICCAVFNLRGTENADPLNVVLISLSHVGVYVVYYLYIEYLSAQIAEHREGRAVPRAVSYISLIICVIGSTLWVVSIVDEDFKAFNAVMRMGVSFELGHIGGLLLILITALILIRNHRILGRRNTIALGSMPVLMLAATFIEPHISGIELHYPLLVLEFCIVYTQHHLEVARQAERDEIAETKARLALAAGRMQPHYLYNVLTTIYYLCDTDPQKAQRAIGTFSDYMRRTLETLEKQELVNFSWELAEIRHYLELEKLRFGDRLTVEYDIEAEDFLVPPLSIQPLVENAVRHGIAPKEEGGTVSIVSRRLSDGGAQIRIKDDGAGFDVTKLRDLDVTHEGIANVRERLRLGVGGELTITSSPGRMTTAVVTIRPQTGDNGRKRNE